MILDNFFLDDWVAVFRISLALLKKFKDDLMVSMDIAFVAQFFHSLKEKIETIDIHELLNDSLQFGLTIGGLKSLEHQYFITQAQERLAPDFKMEDS